VNVGSSTGRVRLSNLDKVLWPRLGLTKGWMLDYYVRVAPVLLAHLRNHPLTLRRFPDGVDGIQWYETRARAHPPWVRTVTFRMASTGKVFDVCVLDDEASLVWAAQIAAIELHPFLGTADALDRPTSLVFDLDPGPPAAIVDCCRIALDIRDLLAGLGLRAWPKTSGGSGIHLHVPLNSNTGYALTKSFAHAVALLLERDKPDAVTSVMSKAKRPGKVFVDWSQNDAGKSTVAPYSLRALEVPTVAAPLTWDEVETAVARRDPSVVTILPDAIVRRIETGDLFAPVATERQSLPAPP
jgi:bifunctional non-homologous end joining protein LigD